MPDSFNYVISGNCFYFLQLPYMVGLSTSAKKKKKKIGSLINWILDTQQIKILVYLMWYLGLTSAKNCYSSEIQI